MKRKDQKMDNFEKETSGKGQVEKGKICKRKNLTKDNSGEATSEKDNYGKATSEKGQ